MNSNLDNILSSIKQLSSEDKIKVLYFLQHEQTNLTNDEIVSYVSKSCSELEKWNKDVEGLLEDNRQFFNELKKSI